MPRYAIALGSSHRFGVRYITRARAMLEERTIGSLVSASRIFENGSFGTKHNCLFYNAVMCLTSMHHPHTLYRELRSIEWHLGRIRSYPNAPRTIDVDVLFSLDFTYSTRNFFLPHSDLVNRIFFVMPAFEALRSARWPVPLAIRNAHKRFGRGYLKPLPSHA